MKKIVVLAQQGGSLGRVSKIGLSLAAGIALAATFWVASSPGAIGAVSTPAELIQSKLPAKMTIANAPDAQLLEAVCKSIKESPKEAALIVRTAAGARQSLRADILCMGVRCSREHRSLDCKWVVDVVKEWIKADPSLASQLTESVSQCAPDCRESLQSIGLSEGGFGGAPPPNNINAPPGSVGGGAGGNACVVCHNGQNVTIACTDLDSYLRSHPGDTAGVCQATPNTNP